MTISRSGDVLKLEPGMLYHHLKKLARTGWVTVDIEPQGTRPPRQVYTLTEDGKEELLRWLREPVQHTREIRLEFLIKLYFARLLDPDLAAELIRGQLDKSREMESGLESRLDASSAPSTTSPVRCSTFASSKPVPPSPGWNRSDSHPDSNLPYGTIAPSFRFAPSTPNLPAEGIVPRGISMDAKILDYAFFEGKMVPFSEANVSIGTHALQYGTGAFAGVRGYLDQDGSTINIFRLPDHAARLANSAKLLRMELPYTADDMARIISDLTEKNAPSGDIYIRPFLYKPAVQLTPRLRGIGDEFAVYQMPMGDYLALDRGQKAVISSWVRIPDAAIPSRRQALRRVCEFGLRQR